MVQSKFVKVKDEGTNMLFLVTKFEPEDAKLLQSKGWIYSPELSIIAAIDHTIQASIATFKHPKYDIENRSKILDVNHTTISLAEIIRDTSFEKIKDLIDVTHYKPEG